MKVYLTGGSGLLGSNLILNLIKQNIDCLAPTHNDCDIKDYDTLYKMIKSYNPDVVIHCAAVAKFKDFEDDPIKGLDTNILGTYNVLRVCMELNIRFVFISSSHVFDGVKGMYTKTDQVNPLTKYSKSKVSGEYMADIHDNSLVIRTEFCGLDFPFDTAFTDKWSSKDYIDKLVDPILEKSLSKETGICHIAGPRRSFYELGLERNPNVKPGSIKEAQVNSKVPILVDTSLVCDNL